MKNKSGILGVVVCGLALATTGFAAAVAPVASQAVAAAGIRITYDMSDLPLTISVDAAGVAQLTDLPFPGEVTYDTSTGTVYYHHSDEEEWISVTPAQLSPLLVSATITAKGAAPAWQGQPSQNWEVKAGQTTCDQWQGSPSAAAQTRLNIADINRILFTVQWLNGGVVPNPCEKLAVAATEAARIGLPVLFTGPNGRWQLQSVEKAADIGRIALPKATAVNDETRLRLLLVQFSPEERASLLKQYNGMSAGKQVEAISQMLSQEALP